MEKEKILQQLEEKLLPSVQNLEKQQATEHDFFPALLWMLLEKSKGSESLLREITSTHSEELEKAVNDVFDNNQRHRQSSNQFVEEKLLELAGNLTVLSNTVKTEQTKDLEAATNRIIENNQESRKIYGEQLGKAANFIASKNQESATKFEQIFHDEFKKVTAVIQENSKIAQEKTDELIENKISAINQKIEDIKTIQLKTQKKLSTGFVAFAIFQLITLSVLAFIVMRPL
ncbi:MAG: hypothetical protein ACXWT3_05760 [Methylococcaceae bacterium]